MGIDIRPATLEDVDAIVDLAASRSLAAIEAAEGAAGGFLVSDLERSEYEHRIVESRFFYVATDDGTIVGFLMAYTSEQLRGDEWLNRRVLATLGAFTVIKQVCVARSHARQGVGSRLYHELLVDLPREPVVAAVVNEPRNEASNSFHRKLGFEELTSLTPPDGRPRLVFVLREARLDVLMGQYGTAIDLYKHEDLLNWQKLNNFFYITTGLAAAFAFMLGDVVKDAAARRALTLGVSTLGATSSLAFLITLYFGRKYLQARKATVVRFEEHIAWHGGQRIVGSAGGDPQNKWLSFSPTGLVMMAVPTVGLIIWGVAITLLLVRLF